MTRWPEEDWERLTDWVELARDDASQMLGLPVASLTLLTGGKANTNYLVETATDRLVLRLYERDRTALHRERRILELVGDAVPTPRMLAHGRAPDGTPWAALEYVEGAHPQVLLEKIDPDQIGFELGVRLAALERVVPPGNRTRVGLLAPDLAFERTFESIGDSFVDLLSWSLREGRARKRLSDEERQRLSEWIDPAASLIEPLNARVALTHGDYKFSNILLHPDGSFAALLDWEFTSVFTPLLDVAILMRHRDEFPAALQTGFERGHGTLPPRWRELSRILDVMNLIGFLNGGGERPRLFAAVRARIMQTVQDSQ